MAPFSIVVQVFLNLKSIVLQTRLELTWPSPSRLNPAHGFYRVECGAHFSGKKTGRAKSSLIIF